MSNGLEFAIFEDFEAYLLHELMEALLSIIHPDLYVVRGDPPDQEAYFHTSQERDHAIILINEIQSEAPIKIEGEISNLSLLTAMELFVARYKDESDKCGLSEALKKLNDWLKSSVKIPFYAPDAGRSGEGAEVILRCNRKALFNLSANIYKHSLFRLSIICSKIVKFCKYKDNRPIENKNVFSIIEPLQERLGGDILIYHASAVLELYFNLFESIWKLLCLRSKNFAVASMHPRIYPSSNMSTHAKNTYINAIKYGHLCYLEDREPCRIIATKYLKMRY